MLETLGKKFTTEILPDMLIFILGKIIAIGRFLHVCNGLLNLALLFLPSTDRKSVV